MSAVNDEFFVDFVDEGWMYFRSLRALVYDVLYREFGVAEDADWHAPTSAEGPVVAAMHGFRLAGTARLVGGADHARLQLRQLAVRPEFRGLGIGRALVEALEEHAREAGADEVWLNARDNAYAFYERLGYEFTGPEFRSELTGIEHRPMRKVLGGVV